MDPKDLIAQQDQVQLVDVREPEEWQAGRIAGAGGSAWMSLTTGSTSSTSISRSWQCAAAEPAVPRRPNSSPTVAIGPQP